VGALHGDAAGPRRPGVRRPAGGERVGPAGRMDRAAGWGPRAQPAERLRGELHPLPRARLRDAGEPLHAGALPPLRRGAA
jgi:hypothetical protein